MRDSTSRRRFVAILGTGIMASVAGCDQDGGGGATPGENGTEENGEETETEMEETETEMEETETEMGTETGTDGITGNETTATETPIGGGAETPGTNETGGTGGGDGRSGDDSDGGGGR